MPAIYPNAAPVTIYPGRDIPDNYPTLNSPTGAATSVVRGLKSSLLNYDASGAASDYYNALAEGDVPRAQANRLRAQQLAQEAAQAAPRVQSLGQINGVGDMGDWAAGVAGQLPVTLVPAVAGGLVGGGLGGALARGVGATVGSQLGAGAALYPQMRDAARLQQAQAEAQGAPLLAPRQVLNDTAKQGAWQSGIEALVPGLAVRSVLGAGARVVGNPLRATVNRIGRDIALDTGAAGVSEGVAMGYETGRNPGRDTSGDAMRYADAMAAEAMGGVPMGALGAAGDLAHSALGGGIDAGGTLAKAGGRALKAGAGRAGEFATKAWDNRPKTLDDAAVMAGEGAANLHNKAEDLLTRIVQHGKDPDVDTLLAPTSKGRDEATMRADDETRHTAAANLVAKIAADTGNVPDYVKAAAQQYAQGSRLMDTYQPLADAVNDWKRGESVMNGVKDMANENIALAGELAGKVHNAFDDATDTYRAKRAMDGRANAQTPQQSIMMESARDDFSPILDEALKPMTSFKTLGASEEYMPFVTHAVRSWVENGFALKPGGELAVPDGLFKMFADPAAAVTTTVDLMHRQGLVDDAVLAKAQTVKEHLDIKQTSRMEAGDIVGSNLVPTALAGRTYSQEGNAQRAAYYQEKLRTTDLSAASQGPAPSSAVGSAMHAAGISKSAVRANALIAEATADFGPRARTVLEALRANDAAAQAKVAGRRVEVSDGRERSVGATVDENGDMRDNAGEALTAGLGAEDMAQMTSSNLDKEAGAPKVVHHVYRPGGLDKTTGELRPDVPFRINGRTKNKEGQADTFHNAVAAKRIADLQTTNGTKVTKQGYMDYLREKHGNDAEGLMGEAKQFIDHKKDELILLQNKTGHEVTRADGTKGVEHDSLDKILNKHYYVLKEEQNLKPGEATNADAASFGREGAKGQIIGNKWAEKNTYGEYGTTKHGRIWLERIGSDGKPVAFATSASRIIDHVFKSRKTEGYGEFDSGLSGQLTALHQGLTSLLTAEGPDGKLILSGRVGFKEKASQEEPAWLAQGDDFPGSLRMFSSTETYKDARAAVQTKRNDAVLTEANKLLKDSMSPKRRKALNASIKAKDYKTLDDFVRTNDRIREEAQSEDETRTTYEHTYVGPFATVADAHDALTDKRDKVVERKDGAFYVQHTTSTQLNTGELGADTYETRQATRVETIARDNQGNKFGSKKIALLSAKEGDRVVKSGHSWVIERDMYTEVRARTGLPTEIGEMGKTSNVRSLQEDWAGSERNVDETTEQTLHTEGAERSVAAGTSHKWKRSEGPNPSFTSRILDALRKGVPVFNKVYAGLETKAQRDEMVAQLQAMLAATSSSNAIWGGKPPADMAAFAKRASMVLDMINAAKALETKPAPAKPAETKAPVQKFTDVADKMHSYLDNPPADFDVKQVEAIRDWATKQEARLNEAKAKHEEGSDEWERLDDMRVHATMLKLKAEKAIKNEAQVKDYYADSNSPVVPSRIGQLADSKTMGLILRLSKKQFNAYNSTAEKLLDGATKAWLAGKSKKDYLGSATASEHLAHLVSVKAVAGNGFQMAIDSIMNNIDQAFAAPLDKTLEAAVEKRLNAARKISTLNDILGDINASTLPDGFKAIAKAVAKVAGNVPLLADRSTFKGTAGFFTPSTGEIFVNTSNVGGKVQTILHEGVHAVTVAAIVEDAELHKAVYALMAHVATKNPKLTTAYGLTNSLEFLAEGLTNVNLQRELFKIPASSAVEKYLGKTLANAWDAFVGLVRKALKLPAEHTSALAQLLELGGRAMKHQGTTGRVTVSGTAMNDFADRKIVPLSAVESALRELANTPWLSAVDRREFQQSFIDKSREMAAKNNGRVTHGVALTAEVMRQLLPALAMRNGTGRVGINELHNTAESILSRHGAAGVIANAMSTRIHEELARPGFAATHDSPIKHEGKFDWRAHIGKGEGNAAFGAGTYLSTANGVHSRYKNQFTAMTTHDALANDAGYKKLVAKRAELEEQYLVAVRSSPAKIESVNDAMRANRRDTEAYVDSFNAKSPTYEVSVDIRPEQLLNWNAPLSEQMDAHKSFDYAFGELAYRVGADKLDFNTTIEHGDTGVGDWGEPSPYHISLREIFESALNGEPMRDGDLGHATGEDLYRVLEKALGSQAKASDYLQSLGILGHKYAAAGGKNDTHPNYVIYDDSKITTNYVHFNKQDPSKAFGTATANAATPEEQAKFHADIMRRLGPQMKSGLLEALMGKDAKGKDIYLSGKWEKGAIYASVYARNLGQIGAHESFHEFFSRMMDEPAAAEVMKLLDRAANSPYIKRQLERLLDGEKEALAQIKDGAKSAVEERMAYMFQFHQAGLLKVGPETEGVFQKLARFFRKVTGLLNDDERADMLLRAFDRGEMQTADAAARVLANSVTARANLYKSVGAAMGPALDRASRLVNTAETNLERTGIKEYSDIRRMFKRSVGESGPQGYLDAKDHMMKQWSNKLAAVFEGKEIKDLELAAKYLHSGERPTDPVVKDILIKLQSKDGLLPQMYKYLTEAGVKRWEPDPGAPGKGEWVPMGKIDHKYFPRAYDTALIMSKMEEFVKDFVEYNAKELNAIAAEQNALLAKSGAEDFTPVTAEDIARTIGNRLINSFGAEIDENSSEVGFSPMMQAVNRRQLHWISPEMLKKYGDKDIARVMTGYVAQGIKRAEYVRRFGNAGEKLKAMLESGYEANVKKLMDGGMKADDAKTKALKAAKGASTDVMAMEGTLGYGINPKMRKFQNSMLVYENMRLLSTSLFSQFIDPLGIVVRGGTATDAWNSYKRGLREVIASIKGDPIKDLDSQIADQVGTTDANGFLAAFGQLYSSQYMGTGFRKANDVLFKYNGMEGFNRGMQVSATRAAINFIKRHVQQPNERSADYLKELNLKPADVKINPKSGELDYTDPVIQQAIHQWVNGSIMRPNSAQRPAWASDPHYMVFWHMKQFAYTFHDVIMKRALHDVKKYGDMGAAGVLVAAYTPVMIATDAIKSVLLTGQEPGWMRAGLGSELQHGAMRGGLMGMFQPEADVMGPNRSILGLGGPVVEQLTQMFNQAPGDAAVNALPGANVWNTLRGGNMVEMQGED